MTAAGPLAAFVQHHYGGVYSDRESQLIAINATYSRLDVLLEAAKRKGELPLRWMLVYSNFRGACGIIGLGPSATRESEDFDGEDVAVPGGRRSP